MQCLYKVGFGSSNTNTSLCAQNVPVNKKRFSLCCDNQSGCNVTVTLRWIYLKKKKSLHTSIQTLKCSRTSSLFSTCSDSELPSLGLFTLKGYLTRSRGADFIQRLRRPIPQFVFLSFVIHVTVCVFHVSEWGQLMIFNLLSQQHHATGAYLATTCILIHMSNKTSAHSHLI